VDRYDPRRNVQLKTLAEYRIRGAILDYLGQLDPLSRDVRRFQRRRDIVSAEMNVHFGHVPSETEIAQKMRIPLARYCRVDQAAFAGTPLHLDMHPAQEIVADSIGSVDERLRRRELYDAINSLPSGNGAF
jgi:RNA polymerase sigma factor for flagellar operon FliA